MLIVHLKRAAYPLWGLQAHSADLFHRLCGDWRRCWTMPGNRAALRAKTRIVAKSAEARAEGPDASSGKQ